MSVFQFYVGEIDLKGVEIDGDPRGEGTLLGAAARHVGIPRLR